jgi:hypothetical protein
VFLIHIGCLFSRENAAGSQAVTDGFVSSFFFARVPKNIRSSYRKIKLYLLFCMGVKHDVILEKVYRLGVYENRFLRRMFGPKRDDVTGDCRPVHNEGLHNLYSSPNIIGILSQGR